VFNPATATTTCFAGTTARSAVSALCIITRRHFFTNNSNKFKVDIFTQNILVIEIL
jgi:hypothetical protein